MEFNIENFKFSYDNYIRIIDHGKKYSTLTNLKEFKGENCIILRHDVDFDIYKAYKLFQIERKLNVKSTYFFMVTSQMYNPLSKNNTLMIQEMFDNGFDIGLHFDPTVYGNIDHPKLKRKLKIECSILERIIEEPIISISLHNPSISGQFPIFNGYKNAYLKDIFSDTYYLSDSLMMFHGKNPFKFLEKSKRIPVQFLTHPLHWSQSGGNYIEIINELIIRKVIEIDNYFSVNKKYLEVRGKKQLIDHINWFNL